MSLARRYAALGIFALLVLQILWHGILLPSDTIPRWLGTALLSLPVLPSAILLVMRRPSAVFWGGVAALFYFCHGIAEAWVDPQALPLALLESGLAVWVVITSSWGGLRARLAKRKKSAPDV